MAGMVLALLLCFVGSSVGTSVYSPYPPRCPAVANPLYGYVKIVSSRCNYYCNSGYRLVGSSYRTCSYGSWKPDPPKCVPVCYCPKLRSPPYGSVSISNYGCKASYQCHQYYKLIGSSVRWCQKGVWNPNEPKCVPVCPYLPHPHYGWVKIDGTSAAYGCNKGYKLVGLSHRKCSYGKWGGYAPKCVLDCPDLHDPSYGWVDVDGHKASYGCNKGYKLVGSKWRYCNYGKWGGYPPKCIPECSDLDDPGYGWVKVSGHKAQYGCRDGYKLVGSQWRYCHYGKWGGHAPKCVPKCPKLDNPHYGWVDVDGYKATYGCNRGYVLVGSKIRACNHGLWLPAAPKCVKVCPRLYNPHYGWVSVSGNKATYRCHTGYKMVGSQYRYCHYGNWAPNAPRCNKIYPACPRLTYPTHGRVDVHDNKATYYCYDDYYMTGSKYCYCRYGRWGCTPPKCLPKKSYVY